MARLGDKSDYLGAAARGMDFYYGARDRKANRELALRKETASIEALEGAERRADAELNLAERRVGVSERQQAYAEKAGDLTASLAERQMALEAYNSERKHAADLAALNQKDREYLLDLEKHRLEVAKTASQSELDAANAARQRAQALKFTQEMGAANAAAPAAMLGMNARMNQVRTYQALSPALSTLQRDVLDIYGQAEAAYNAGQGQLVMELEGQLSALLEPWDAQVREEQLQMGAMSARSRIINAYGALSQDIPPEVQALLDTAQTHGSVGLMTNDASGAGPTAELVDRLNMAAATAEATLATAEERGALLVEHDLFGKEADKFLGMSTTTINERLGDELVARQFKETETYRDWRKEWLQLRTDISMGKGSPDELRARLKQLQEESEGFAITGVREKLHVNREKLREAGQMAIANTKRLMYAQGLETLAAGGTLKNLRVPYSDLRGGVTAFDEGAGVYSPDLYSMEFSSNAAQALQMERTFDVWSDMVEDKKSPFYRQPAQALMHLDGLAGQAKQLEREISEWQDDPDGVPRINYDVIDKGVDLLKVQSELTGLTPRQLVTPNEDGEAMLGPDQLGRHLYDSILHINPDVDKDTGQPEMLTYKQPRGGDFGDLYDTGGLPMMRGSYKMFVGAKDGQIHLSGGPSGNTYAPRAVEALIEEGILAVVPENTRLRVTREGGPEALGDESVYDRLQGAGRKWSALKDIWLPLRGTREVEQIYAGRAPGLLSSTVSIGGQRYRAAERKPVLVNGENLRVRMVYTPKAFALFGTHNPSMEQMLGHPEHGAAIRMALNRTLPGDKRGIAMPLTVEEEADK